MDSGLIALFGGVLIIGIGLLIVIALTRKHPKALDQEKFRSAWMKLSQSIQESNPASWQVAVMDADKLLDKALQDRGTSGNTLADRLKIAGNSFSDVDTVWKAHKLRNKIAHEHDFKLSYSLTNKALEAFKQALKDLEAI